MRRLRTLLLTALATLLLGGCFRYQTAIVVDDDGSGRVQEILLFDRSALASVFDSEAQIDQHVPRAADFRLPSWATARDYRQGDLDGVILETTFDDPEQFDDRLNTLHLMLIDAVGSQATAEVDLERIEDGWTFTLRTADLAELPALPGPADPAVGELYRRAQLVLSVHLPGRIVDHNADEIVDGQLVWRLSANAVQTLAYARTATGGALTATATTSRPLQAATALATAGGLAVFASVAYARRRNRSRGGSDRSTPDRHLHLGDRAAEDPGPPQRWPAQPPSRPPSAEPRPTDRPPLRSGPC